PPGTRHAVPERRAATAARDGHGQGVAGLRAAVAHPPRARLRPDALHLPDDHLPDRPRARPAEGPGTRVRGHRRRAGPRGGRRGRARVRRAGPSRRRRRDRRGSPPPRGGRARRARVAGGRALPAPGGRSRRPGGAAPGKRRGAAAAACLSDAPGVQPATGSLTPRRASWATTAVGGSTSATTAVSRSNVATRAGAEQVNTPPE